MSLIVGCGTPNLLRANHSASRGTESYAFFKSMKTRNDFAQDFSTRWRTVKIMSEHPRPFLNPHWDSGSSSSARLCNLSWMILATTFPTTSSRAMPLQLSHLLSFPFLSFPIASVSSWCFSQMVSYRSLSGSHDFGFIELALDVQYPSKVPPPLLLLCYQSAAWVAVIINYSS